VVAQKKQSTIRRLIQIAGLCSIPLRSTASSSVAFASINSPAYFPFKKKNYRLMMSTTATTATNKSGNAEESVSSNEELRKEKQVLRTQLRLTMKNLTAQEIEVQSKSVWERVFELPIYQSAKSVGLFLSMPMGEINTDTILQHCVQNDKIIYVPEVGENFELCDMELRKVILDDSEKTADEMFHKAWPKNKWNIPEPPGTMLTVVAKPGDIDLMIVPGLGFDRSCNRLGQGKGYYDRFIAKMVKDNDLPLLAVALKPQLVGGIQKIPVAEYDRKMDMLVLPDEIIEQPL